MTHLRVRCGVLVMAVLMTACQRPAPGPIHYGSDACDHCRMTIMNPFFAAQLVTRTGKTYRFDDPGCLVAFVSAGRVHDKAIHSAWVNDHDNPSSVLHVRDAFFVVSDEIKGPMNGHLAAFQSLASAEAAQKRWAGRIDTWDALVSAGRP